MKPERAGPILDELVGSLRDSFPQLLSVYRFGSFGTEYERPESGLDFAVYAVARLSAVELWRAAQELASRAGRDVVDLARASTVMRAQVVHEGERLYCADETACGTFEDYAYSSYARLNEERREIPRDILSRGSVYG